MKALVIFLILYFFQSSLSKGASSKTTSKRADVKTGSSLGGIQNAGIIKTSSSNTPATVLPQPTSTAESKGADIIQDKAGKGSSSSLFKNILSLWKKMLEQNFVC